MLDPLLRTWNPPRDGVGGIEPAALSHLEFVPHDYRACGKLVGRVALIAGAATGIHRSVATLFAREGARVTLAYPPEQHGEAEETARLVEQTGHEARLLPLETGMPRSIEEGVRSAWADSGQLDILVGDVGLTLRPRPDDNGRGTSRRSDLARLLRASAEFLPVGAAIVLTGTARSLASNGSGNGRHAPTPDGPFREFTKSLAERLSARGLRVNGVLAEHPEDAGPACVFFASTADSGAFTGTVLTPLGN